MTSSGAVLDVSFGMHPVTCQIAGNFTGNPSETVRSRVGTFSPDAEKSPRRVLVVDDEPLIRWSVAESLSDLGMDVRQAGDAASALRAVTTSREPFDVVVLDLRLPDMRDLSLLATLRQLMPEARLVLMTAFGSADTACEAALLGACVLNKPFELDDMHRAVLGTRRGQS